MYVLSLGSLLLLLWRALVGWSCFGGSVGLGLVGASFVVVDDMPWYCYGGDGHVGGCSVMTCIAVLVALQNRGCLLWSLWWYVITDGNSCVFVLC